MKFKHVKKLGALFLAATMLTAVLTGCGNNQKAADNTTQGAAESSAAEGTQASGENQAVVNSKDVVELKVVTMGTPPTSGLDAFYEAMDALTVPDLGVKIRLQHVSWGEEGTKIPLAITGGEADLICCGPWANFDDYAAKNAFADMTPYISEMPELIEFFETNMGEGYVEKMKTNGKLFGLTQLSDGVGGDGFLYRQDLQEEWGLAPVTDFNSAEAYLYAAKENGYNYSIADSRLVLFLWEMTAGNKYVQVSGSGDFNGLTYLVAPIDDPYHAVSVFETEEFRKCCEIAEKWYADGIVKSDVLAGRAGDAEVLFAQDVTCVEACNHLAVAQSTIAPKVLGDNPEWKLNFASYYFFNNGTPIFKPTTNTTRITISSQSKYPELAMKFIEKAYTDETYSKLLQYGVEGVNYVDQDGVAVVENADEKFPCVTGFSNFVFSYGKSFSNDEWKANYEASYNKIFEAMQSGNQYNPYDGFTFDSTAVTSQFANMENVKAEYGTPLTCGVIQSSLDKDLEVFRKAMEQAGAREYVAEFQRQLDEFAAGK